MNKLTRNLLLYVAAPVVVTIAIANSGNTHTSQPVHQLSQAEIAATAAHEAAFQNVVTVLKDLQTNARNEGSLQWDEISGSDDGKLVCVAVRGQNGFGGMTLDHVTAVNGKLSQASSAWN